MQMCNTHLLSKIFMVANVNSFVSATELTLLYWPEYIHIYVYIKQSHSGCHRNQYWHTRLLHTVWPMSVVAHLRKGWFSCGILLLICCAAHNQKRALCFQGQWSTSLTKGTLTMRCWTLVTLMSQPDFIYLQLEFSRNKTCVNTRLHRLWDCQKIHVFWKAVCANINTRAGQQVSANPLLWLLRNVPDTLAQLVGVVPWLLDSGEEGMSSNVPGTIDWSPYGNSWFLSGPSGWK